MAAKFIARYQFKGSVEWLCTFCLAVTRSHVWTDSPNVTCDYCGKSYKLGVQYWESPKGRYWNPPDIAIPYNVRAVRPVIFRARLIGALKFVCPACGHLFKRQLNGRTWRIECTNTAKNKTCGRPWIVGVTIGPPEPLTIPTEAMPIAPFAGRWKSRQPIHAAFPC